jgi:hypothetical protein
MARSIISGIGNFLTKLKISSSYLTSLRLFGEFKCNEDENRRQFHSITRSATRNFNKSQTSGDRDRVRLTVNSDHRTLLAPIFSAHLTESPQNLINTKHTSKEHNNEIIFYSDADIFLPMQRRAILNSLSRGRSFLNVVDPRLALPLPIRPH